MFEFGMKYFGYDYYVKVRYEAYNVYKMEKKNSQLNVRPLKTELPDFRDVSLQIKTSISPFFWKT